MEENEVILRVEHVDRQYADDDQVVDALSEVDLSVKRGEFISIIGASGCGKTTLLRLIAGLDKPQNGHLYLYDEYIAASRKFFQAGLLMV